MLTGFEACARGRHESIRGGGRRSLALHTRATARNGWTRRGSRRPVFPPSLGSCRMVQRTCARRYGAWSLSGALVRKVDGFAERGRTPSLAGTGGSKKPLDRRTEWANFTTGLRGRQRRLAVTQGMLGHAGHAGHAKGGPLQVRFAASPEPRPRFHGASNERFAILKEAALASARRFRE